MPSTLKPEGPKSISHGAEMAEIAPEGDHGNTAEIFRTAAKLATLFLHGVEYPRAELSDVVDNQLLFLRPVHPGLAINVQICRSQTPNTVNRLISPRPAT